MTSPLPDTAALLDTGHIADHNLIVAAIASKADTTAVTSAISSAVASKAEQSTVDSLTTTVAGKLDTTTATATYLSIGPGAGLTEGATKAELDAAVLAGGGLPTGDPAGSVLVSDGTAYQPVVPTAVTAADVPYDSTTVEAALTDALARILALEGGTPVTTYSLLTETGDVLTTEAGDVLVTQ